MDERNMRSDGATGSRGVGLAILNGLVCCFRLYMFVNYLTKDRYTNRMTIICLYLIVILNTFYFTLEASR